MEYSRPLNDVRLEMIFKRELKRAKRHKEPLTLMYIEPALPVELPENLRDRAFRQITRAVRKILRDEDTEIAIGRRILLILPETFPDGADAVEKRIREKIATLTFTANETGLSFKAQLHLGKAHHPADGDTGEALMQKALSELQAAKSAQAAEKSP